MPLLALLALAQTNWKPYTLAGFVFLMPEPPVEQKVPNTPKGSRYWLSMHNGKNAIVVTVAPIAVDKNAAADGVLAAMVGGSLDETGSKLLAQADALFAGWPAVDFRYKTPDGLFGVSKAVYLGDKLMQIGVTGPSEAAALGAYDKSVTGLALAPGTAKGELTAIGPIFARRKIMESSASVEMPTVPKERTAPVNDKPDALILHTQYSNYGNRSYSATYADIPEGKGPKDEEVSAALQAINDDVVRSLKAKAQPSVDTKLDGAYAIRTVATMGTNGYATVITSIHEGRLYTLLAIVPLAWKDNPEPKRFFESFRMKD